MAFQVYFISGLRFGIGVLREKPVEVNHPSSIFLFCVIAYNPLEAITKHAHGFYWGVKLVQITCRNEGV